MSMHLDNGQPGASPCQTIHQGVRLQLLRSYVPLRVAAEVVPGPCGFGYGSTNTGKTSSRRSPDPPLPFSPILPLCRLVHDLRTLVIHSFEKGADDFSRDTIPETTSTRLHTVVVRACMIHALAPGSSRSILPPLLLDPLLDHRPRRTPGPTASCWLWMRESTPASGPGWGLSR